jgi:hypothetical protein
MLSNALVSAEIYEEDYNAIVAVHGLCSWFLNGNGKGKFYVRLKGHHDNVVQVSRLILGDLYKGHVSYKDGNHLNLRTTNLIVQGGTRKKPKAPKKPQWQPLGSGLRIPVRSTNG